MLPAIDANILERLCAKYRVKRLALFGSTLTQEDRPDSDIDLLVEFEETAHPGWTMYELEDELSQLFGRPVDLNTPGFLSRSFRESVVNSARTLYATSQAAVN
jgi:predicted nucleotidyltransferase